jgi:hypothetical protein
MILYIKGSFWISNFMPLPTGVSLLNCQYVRRHYNNLFQERLKGGSKD